MYTIYFNVGRNWLLQKRFWTKIVHANGQTLWTSEMYNSLQAAQDTANNFFQAMSSSNLRLTPPTQDLWDAFDRSRL